MSEIRAIVFDANVFGRKALPNMETIRLWAQACSEHDAELWIPEVVAYELAQHVVEAHDGFREQHDAHRRRLVEWGQAPADGLPPIDAENVLDAIRNAGAEIIALDEESAREAILDQILLTGAGSRKGGVKTGAADSAWIRSVIAHNGGESEGLIVITGDTRALELTCAALGVEVPNTGKHLGAVSHLLDDYASISGELSEKFNRWVHEYFVVGGPRGEGADLQELADVGRYNWWEIAGPPDDGYEEWALQDQVLTPVTEATVISEVEHDRWTGTLTATVQVNAGVEEQYSRQDPYGNYVQHRIRTYPVSIRARLRLFIEDGELTFDGVLEDIELIPPNSADIGWDEI